MQTAAAFDGRTDVSPTDAHPILETLSHHVLQSQRHLRLAIDGSGNRISQRLCLMIIASCTSLSRFGLHIHIPRIYRGSAFVMTLQDDLPVLSHYFGTRLVSVEMTIYFPTSSDLSALQAAELVSGMCAIIGPRHVRSLRWSRPPCDVAGFEQAPLQQMCQRLRTFAIFHPALSRLSDVSPWLNFGLCGEMDMDIGIDSTLRGLDPSPLDNILSVITPLRDKCDVLTINVHPQSAQMVGKFPAPSVKRLCYPDVYKNPGLSAPQWSQLRAFPQRLATEPPDCVG